MFPRWFDKWNRENPRDIYGPAIAIGVVGGAVFAATMLVAFGQPYATDSLQTGPRGTGMSVPEFEADLAKPDPGIAGFLATTSAPVIPQGGEEAARTARENVPPGLEDLTVENYDRLLAAMRAWTGIPDLFENPDSYQTAVGHTMIAMTRTINEEWAGHVNANKQVGVTCYTCHRGQPVPSDIWFRISPVNESAEGWSANQNRVTVQSQFTSLPSDALEKYLLDGETIGVHDLESRVAGVPGQDGYPGRIEQVARPSDVYYFADGNAVQSGSRWSWRFFSYPSNATNSGRLIDVQRHTNGANIVFADGHGKRTKQPAEIDTISTPDEFARHYLWQ